MLFGDFAGVDSEFWSGKAKSDAIFHLMETQTQNIVNISNFSKIK
jgi:hypothetical protein